MDSLKRLWNYAGIYTHSRGSGNSWRFRDKSILKRKKLPKRKPRDITSYCKHEDYLKYLQSKEWQSKRHGALKRAKHACEICHSKDIELHVHHKTYKHIRNEHKEDLIVLCFKCHARLHKIEPGGVDLGQHQNETILVPQCA